MRPNRPTPATTGPLRRSLVPLALLLGAAPLAGPPAHATETAPSFADLKQMPLEELLALDVTTVSRKAERWWDAPGAIDVVTSEDIRRSGARSLPEALRLATGVDVAQSSARSWGISLRGFDVLAANKISVVMDGRSLYTPFFSGVLWDAQDALLEDVDRIEVVRGPVGSLWGAFAVNGFIQILTKPADETQGWYVSGGAGTEDPGFLAARYGGKIGAQSYYRVYAQYRDMDWTYLPSGGHAEPSTDFFQSGFRVDSALPDATITLQGDAYTNKGLPADREQTEISGANVLGRWRRLFTADSDLEVVSYYDYTSRLIPLNWSEERHTGSLSAKYRLPLDRHDLLVGVDAMISSDAIGNISAAQFLPDHRTTHNLGLYVEDTFHLMPDRIALTGGVKGEHNSFSGFEYAPTARVAWTPSPRTTWWAAVSRAVRAPVRIDQDFVFNLGGTTLFQANDDFRSEKVVATELGVRRQVGSSLTVELSTFLNHYTDVRSYELQGDAPLPYTFKNTLEADSSGAEATVRWQPLARLSFKASYRYLDLDFSKTAGSRDIGNAVSEADDPHVIAAISARADLPWHLELDAAVRHTGDRPNPAVPAYTVADLRLGWRPAEAWEFSVSGRNLFAPLHRELVTTNSLNEEVGPSGFVQATWRY